MAKDTRDMKDIKRTNSNPDPINRVRNDALNAQSEASAAAEEGDERTEGQPGGAIGAVTGGLAGKGAAESVNPTNEDAYWRENFKSRPYYNKEKSYEHYAPAYRYGWESASKHNGRRFEDVENDLSRGWNTARGKATSEWNELKDATRDAFDRVRTRFTTPGMTKSSELPRSKR